MKSPFAELQEGQIEKTEFKSLNFHLDERFTTEIRATQSTRSIRFKSTDCLIHHYKRFCMKSAKEKSLKVPYSHEARMSK